MTQVHTSAMCIHLNDIFKSNPLYVHTYSAIKVNSNVPTIFLSSGSEIAQASGFTVCPYFIGHGIGSYFHCHPAILHHGEFASTSVHSVGLFE